jgi:hypothetical protein
MIGDRAGKNMLRWIFFYAVAVGISVSSGATAQTAPRFYAKQIANACEGLGLDPSEAPYAFCAMSLQDAAAGVEQAHNIGVARRVCARKGYRVGTPAFANCVLDREDEISESQPKMPAPVATNEPFRTYQRPDQRKAVPRACAQLGLDPGSSAFSTCVSNLNMTLDDSNMVGSD